MVFTVTDNLQLFYNEIDWQRDWPLRRLLNIVNKWLWLQRQTLAQCWTQRNLKNKNSIYVTSWIVLENVLFTQIVNGINVVLRVKKLHSQWYFLF